MSFNRDYNFGIAQENTLLPKLSAFFGETLVKTSKLCKWDFESVSTVYEMKSRNNTYNAYPTTLLPFDKIVTDKKQVFIFNFQDNVYYIEYSKSLFDSFELKDFRRFRAGVNDKKKLYLHIPITALKKIDLVV
jgi:hypothetical protein